MPVTMDKVYADAMQLTPEQRADLVDRLIVSSTQYDGFATPEIQRAWEQEIRRRIQEVVDGTAQLLDGEPILQALREGRRP